MTPKFLTVSEKGTDALPTSKESGIERVVDILLEETIIYPKLHPSLPITMETGYVVFFLGWACILCVENVV